jgi:TonB family protein
MPIVIDGGPAAPAPVAIGFIRAYLPGPARCGGETVLPTQIVDPVPDGVREYPGAAAGSGNQVALSFDIGTDGRPVGIETLGTPHGEYIGADGDDVEPAFAAWRFAPGQPRKGCTITFAGRPTPVAEADPELLYRYLSTRASSLFRYSVEEVTDAAWQRVRPEGATCPRRPGARLWVWPDFDTISQPLGTFAWNFFAFDVDAKGKATHLRLAASSGNSDLDRKSMGALHRSVFTRPGSGCGYNFFRGPSAPLPAPDRPEHLSVYREASATCPEGGDPAHAGWAFTQSLTYPENFRRRGIEGWAVIRYDVAPWGQTGNVTVADAQPASGFGVEARLIVEQSRRKPAPFGYTGCLELVRFVLPPPDGVDASPARAR